MNHHRARLARLVDAAQYAIGVTVIASVGFLPLAAVTPAGLFWVKFGLFVTGTVTIGYATYLAWPSSQSDLTDGSVDSTRETRLQALLRRAPPAAQFPIPPSARYPNWTKLYLSGVMMFSTSFLLEVVFGVTA